MRRLCPFLLVLFFVGCRDKTPEAQAPVARGPVELKEVEPNGRPEQALRLSEDANVSATLAVDPAAPDEDWYLLETTTALPRVDLRVSGIPGGDVAFEVYDEHRNRQVAVNSEGLGQGERLPNLYLTGRRYLRVYSAKKGTGGAYVLEARFTPAEPGEEQEPNDRAADANAIPSATPVTGLLGHAGDEDWYRIDLVAAGVTGGADGGLAQDPAAPIQPGAAMEPAAVDRERTQPGGQAPGMPGEPAAIPPDVEAQESALPHDQEADDEAPPRDLWARLNADPDDETGSRTPDRPLPDREVPGSATDAGDRFGVGAAASSALGSHLAPPPPAPAPPSVALRIELTGIEDVSQEVRILSEAEAVLFETKTRPGEGLSLRNIGVRPHDQMVYVVVRPAWIGSGKQARRAFSATRPYTLTVAREEGGANAELEPNEDLDRATPISPEVYREGFLSQPQDVDTFVLEAPEPVIADFHVTGVEGVDLALVLVEPSERGAKVLMSAREGGVKEPEQLNGVACHGKCYVRVESAQRRVDGKLKKDYANPDVPYRLTVTTRRDDGSHEREPNNDPATATPITVGKPMRGTIHPVKDRDLYRLDLSDRAVKTPFRAHLTGILKVDVGLYLHRLEGDGALTLVQTAEAAKGDGDEVISFSAEPGVYVLEVRDTRNRESNFQDRYQLTVLGD